MKKHPLFLALSVLAVVLGFLNARADVRMDATVRIINIRGQGTGVVVKSDMSKGYPETSIITAFHLVTPNMRIIETQFGKKVTVFKPLTVEWFYYKRSKLVETITRTANVVKWDEKTDLALLQVVHHFAPLRDGVAIVATLALPNSIQVFDVDGNPTSVISIGAGLGERPFPTQGIVGSIDVVRKIGVILHSASIINGFSGGGLWSENELIGINVNVASWASPLGFEIPVPFMGYAIPVNVIRDFIK